ncbi:MAG: glycosyltransferase family 39 protein [Thermodesulfobacteriota bacterium]|nr:MAG: glycosyltransferase family 39 protein [Thermodesulfobacteriota bacterium]
MSLATNNPAGDGAAGARQYMAWLIVIAVSIVCASIRIHLLDVPLERDEGEYAYAAQLLLNGIPPYEHMHTMKLPGVFGAYAIFMLAFGQSTEAIHLGLTLLNALTSVLVFLLARKFLEPLPSAFSSAFFSILSMNSAFLGLSANAEHFAVLFIVAGALFLFKSMEAGKAFFFFLCGLFFGVAFLMKQHAVFFMGLPVVYLSAFLLRTHAYPFGKRLSRTFLFVAGAGLPFGLTCLVFMLWGVFDKFFFWTFSYASKYVSLISLSDGLSNLGDAFSLMKDSALPLLAIAGAGLFFPPHGESARSARIFFWSFLVISAISILPGLYFRSHYFILVLPAAALFFGAAVSRVKGVLERYGLRRAGWALACVFLLVLAYPLYKERTLLFFSSPDEISRIIYGANPFPESVGIARYIRENSGPDDRVAVLGSEPQIYFLSNRLSATGYIYMYPIVEGHAYSSTMEMELRNDIAEGKPLFLVYVNIPVSWGITNESMPKIADWFSRFDLSGYSLEGVVEIKRGGPQYYWSRFTNVDYSAKDFQGQAVYVLKRIS